MSKGGGSSQKTTSEPWGAAQPYLKDVMQQAQNLYKQGGPQYYPGQTYNDPTAAQTAAWGQAQDYANQVFGGQNTPKFGQASDALSGVLTGNNQLGSMANQFGGLSGQALGSSFASPFGTAGGLDARSAIQQQLSGTPNYSAVQGATNAANQQQWNQLYNDVIPQLNQRASFLNNPTGSIKSLNSAITNLTNNQNLNAQQAYLGEYNRAQSAQANAAGLVSQGGLSSQQNALGLGNLAGSLAQGASGQQLQGINQFNSLANAGQYPSQLAQQYANWQAGFGDKALQEQIDRYNYNQNLPYQNLSQYSGIINGYGGLGGTTTQPGGSRGAGALGGALSGAQLGSQYGPWGSLIGAIGGGFLGGS